MYWVTAKGEKISITEMSDKHLDNAINYLKRLLNTAPAYQAYVGESEIAETCVDLENQHNEEIKEELKYKLSILEREKTRRNLIKEDINE